MRKAIAVLLLLGQAAAQLIGTSCPGLSVNTGLNQEKGVIVDGRTDNFWNGNANKPLAGADEIHRFFYVTKKGAKPLKVESIYVNVTSPHGYPAMSPTLGGDVFNKMEISNQSSELEVNYDCHPKGKGTSFIWVSIKVSQYESMENCHYSLPEGRGQTFTFLWSKYCPGNLKPRKGFNIGTYKGGSDVVRDGVPVVQFTPSYIKHDYHQYVVPAGTNTMTMWIHMSDNSVQRYGDPKLEGWSETKMDPDVSGQAAIGGIASSDSQAFKMTFRCKPLRAASASLMSVTINLCRMSEDASGELLPCDSNHKWSNEAINLEFTKYCVHGPGGMGFWKTLWLLIVIFGSCGCVFGCYHKFKHEGARGLEVIPCIDAIRGCCESCHEQFAKRSGAMSINSSTARRSQTKSVAMPKYQQAASSDAGLEAGDNEPYEDDEDFDFSIEDFGAPDGGKKGKKGGKSGTAAASYQAGAPPTSDAPLGSTGSGGSYGSM